ncbi:GntR family transcriptional regulator [Paenibacillus sp. NPDC056579]|uniref:GntR family transcriptional regulator n=1 Tax=unclassified Paenibacillus TaxID=185978 RepID=UPI001EF83B04|nr:GntR family transcriptional regulator [Paenibacillus sp. H1-7]ULL17190.1 GntR family transcriptional regulator [Paenibacillus sp. H1-7]
MELPKIDTSNLWDKTYSILKDQIIRRRFSPNEKLSIPELADQLGVSRTPVRDALNRLEMERLVKTVSKVGTFVVAISSEDIKDIMDTRLMLEFWVIDKLASVSKDAVQAGVSRMQTIIDLSLQKIDAEPLRDYLHADYNLAFHIEFMKLGQNRNNIDIYLKLMDYRFIMTKSSIVSSEMVKVAQAQHQTIVDAVKSGNVDDIRSVIRLHLDDSERRLLKAIHENGGTI